MKVLVMFSLLSTLSFPLLAAKKDDHWYKVEPKQEEKKVKSGESYTYDSLDNKSSNEKFSEVGFWSLRPKFSLGTGLLTDGEFSDFPILFNGSIYFSHHPWYRWSINALVVSDNSMLVNGSLEFTPSRKAQRFYYGFGIANQLVADKKFSNLVDIDNYFITGHYGLETLMRNGHGWSVEGKAYVNLSDFILQVGVNYIIPL